MNTTKYYVNHFWPFLAAIVSSVLAIIGIAIAAGSNMISYYCTSGNSFLSLHFWGNPFCYLILASIYFLIGVVGLIVIFFVGAGLIDVSKFIAVTTWNGIEDYFTRIRPANLDFLCHTPENEAYIIVHNEESLLNADRVYARVDYNLNPNNHISDYIKWHGQSNTNIETSISHKQNKLLHFATINTEEKTFTVHRTKEEVTFTFPKENHEYRFPIYVIGSMFFLWFRISRVFLERYFEIIVGYKEKDDILIRIDEHEEKLQVKQKDNPS